MQGPKCLQHCMEVDSTYFDNRRKGLDINNLGPDNDEHCGQAEKFFQGGLFTDLIDQLEHWSLMPREVSNT